MNKEILQGEIPEYERGKDEREHNRHSSSEGHTNSDRHESTCIVLLELKLLQLHNLLH